MTIDCEGCPLLIIIAIIVIKPFLVQQYLLQIGLVILPMIQLAVTVLIIAMIIIVTAVVHLCQSFPQQMVAIPSLSSLLYPVITIATVILVHEQPLILLPVHLA